jgi:predicted nuclease of predicted toxin-antitoxin system
MLRCATDENFNGAIVRMLLTRQPNINVVRVQDTHLSGAEDPNVLDWCAAEQRILLSHDIATLKDFAYARVTAGLPMSGVFISDQYASARVIVEDLLMIVACSAAEEWANQVWHLPL